MSDHEFEKKVTQKMDDLRLRPSDAVWAEVERELRREKRRRRVILWIPLMGILLTAGGYFIFKGTGSADKASLVKTEPAAKKAEPSVSSLPSAKRSSSSSPKNITERSTQNSTQSNTEVKKQEIVAAERLTVEKKKPVRQSSTKPKKSREIEEVADAPITETNIAAINDNNKTTTDTVNNSISKSDTTAKAIIPKDTTAKAITPKDTTAKKPAEKLIAKTPKKKKSSESKWQWGINANASVANVSEGNLFDVLKEVRVYDLANASPSYNGIPPVPTPEASPIRPGPAFSVGGFLQRKISKRVSLSVGLQYSYFTVNTRVGKKVDSMLAVNYGQFNSRIAGSYYGGDNRQDYTNRYHFIEMPVMASIHILGKKKMPIVLDAGFSLSRLVNTNALHFDGITGVYYENDDFFKNMQVSLNTGLNIGLFQNSRHPLFVGPNLRYFTTGLIRKEVTASGGEQHIWSFGLNAKMLLKK